MVFVVVIIIIIIIIINIILLCRVMKLSNRKADYITSPNWQRVSRAKTVGLGGGQLNATRSIAAGRKILDRTVKSVM